MCGIIGFCADEVNEHHIDLLLRLIYQSKIRGLHSFGIATIMVIT